MGERERRACGVPATKMEKTRMMREVEGGKRATTSGKLAGTSEAIPKGFRTVLSNKELNEGEHSLAEFVLRIPSSEGGREGTCR